MSNKESIHAQKKLSQSEIDETNNFFPTAKSIAEWQHIEPEDYEPYNILKEMSHKVLPKYSESQKKDIQLIVDTERERLTGIYHEAVIEAAEIALENLNSEYFKENLENTTRFELLGKSIEKSEKIDSEKYLENPLSEASQMDKLENLRNTIYLIDILRSLERHLFAGDQETVSCEIFSLFGQMGTACHENTATSLCSAYRLNEEKKKAAKKATDIRYSKTRELKYQAINTAMELWDEPEHEAKTHDKMARYLIEQYTEGDLLYFSGLKYNGLKKALKDHLKEIDRTDLIFNG